jgi:hypothetical protein
VSKASQNGDEKRNLRSGQATTDKDSSRSYPQSKSAPMSPKPNQADDTKNQADDETKKEKKLSGQ